MRSNPGQLLRIRGTLRGVRGRVATEAQSPTLRILTPAQSLFRICLHFWQFSYNIGFSGFPIGRSLIMHLIEDTATTVFILTCSNYEWFIN
jgi:hypothetical protein